MNKDLEKGVRDIAKSQRLDEEEKMHINNLAGTIEVNEDIEDKNDIISRLKKQLKIWRGIFWTGFVVLILIVLYMIYNDLIVNVLFQTDDNQEIAVEVAPDVEQTKVTIELYAIPVVPETDAKPEHTTLAELVSCTSSSSVELDEVGWDYDIDNNYYISYTPGHILEILDLSLSVVTESALDEFWNNLPLQYTFVDKDNFESYFTRDSYCYDTSDFSCGDVQNSYNNEEIITIFYTNTSFEHAISCGMTEDDMLGVSGVANDLHFWIYGEIDEEEAQSIFAKMMSNNKTYGILETNFDDVSVLESTGYDYNGFGASFDKCYTDDRGRTVLVKDRESYIPEIETEVIVHNYSISFNPLAIGLYKGWF